MASTDHDCNSRFHELDFHEIRQLTLSLSVKLMARATNEMKHFRKLASANAELALGWGTAAGRIRAQRRAALISEGAHLSSHVRALEIGCGIGTFTEMFAATGAKLTAVDLSSELLSMANHKLANVEFLQGRFEDMDFERAFDAVIGSSILHHLDLEEALPKIFNALKPKGIMCFTEPNMLNPQVFAERTFRRLFWYVSPDETAFVRFKLKALLEGFGFSKVEVIPFEWLHPLAPKRLIRICQSVGSALEKLPLVSEFSGSLCINCMRRP